MTAKHQISRPIGANALANNSFNVTSDLPDLTIQPRDRLGAKVPMWSTFTKI
jgi:hypothetical protein